MLSNSVLNFTSPPARGLKSVFRALEIRKRAVDFLASVHHEWPVLLDGFAHGLARNEHEFRAFTRSSLDNHAVFAVAIGKHHGVVRTDERAVAETAEPSSVYANEFHPAGTFCLNSDPGAMAK
eukprot:CAMPEP_0174580640 /NCGR_PEP_ID=MMETSP0929-20130131/2297_1 /TAXON_ID=548131 ORGANISM="Ostreococcus mediterraneus, Strain clade-D-RCC2572" /NCGR_SAMPLE_ID=MMETSP0929 /ASSEMBLY_ACC=CAM_ASM_000573 /LENGTH=122 /DNA_ID=CAMNT_0015762087 /DNA_START=81 /DNA_END=450 /DNA_ORIENTATION=+